MPVCVAIVQPVREKQRRRCGLPARREVEGRPLCKRHLRVHAIRQAFVQEKAAV